MSDLASSVWRTACFSALFETEPVRMPQKFADAHAAIKERLNSPIEISKLEHQAVEAARTKLATLKVANVEVVKLSPLTGDKQ
jgi:hypothetical protein